MSIKVGRKHHDMRIAGRIVGVRSTKQSIGIKMLRTVDSHELADKNSKRYEIVMRNRLKRTDKEVERRWTKEN